MYIRVKDHIDIVFPFCYLSLINQNCFLFRKERVLGAFFYLFLNNFT